MVLVRIAYAADLPSPDDVIRTLGAGSRSDAPLQAAPAPVSGGERPQAMTSRYEAPRAASQVQAAPARSETVVRIAERSEAAERSETAPARSLTRFVDIVALAAEKRDLTIKAALERDVRLVRMEDGRLEIALESGAPRSIVQDLSRKLSDWTGRRWMVVVSAEQGEQTLRAQAEARQAELEVGVRGDPLVQAVLNRFPGAQIVGVRGPAGNAGGGDAEPPAEPMEDVDEES
jgi:DNA polymerase-3 subunit gamma/tau